MFNVTSSVDPYSFDRLLLFEDAFMPWQEVEHPDYGKGSRRIQQEPWGRNIGIPLESDAPPECGILHLQRLGDIQSLNLGCESAEHWSGLREVSAIVVNSTDAYPFRLQPRYKIDPPDYVP
jgi:hypothetical protein